MTFRVEDGDGWEELLTAAGFDRRQPTFWMLEGLTLDEQPNVLDHLMKEINSLSAMNSQLLCEMALGGNVAIEESDDGHISLVAHDDFHYGSNAGVFRGLSDWPYAILANRRSIGDYVGDLWDPIKLSRLILRPDEMKYGPWFVLLFSKLPHSERRKELVHRV